MSTKLAADLQPGDRVHITGTGSVARTVSEITFSDTPVAAGDATSVHIGWVEAPHITRVSPTREFTIAEDA